MTERFIAWGREPRRGKPEATPIEPVVPELTVAGRENLRTFKRNFADVVDTAAVSLTALAARLHSAKKKEVGSRHRRGLISPTYTDTGFVQDGADDYSFRFTYQKKRGLIVPESYTQSVRHVQEQLSYPANHATEPRVSVIFTEGKITNVTLEVGAAKSLREWDILVTKAANLEKTNEELRFALPNDGQLRRINLSVDVHADRFMFVRNDGAVNYSFDPEHNKFVYVPRIETTTAEGGAEQKEFDAIMTYDPDDVTRYVSEMLSLIPLQPQN